MDGPSRERMMHKVIMKLLQLQIQQSSSSSATVPSIWATGGHSLTAGHNLYDESYTAFLEKAAAPLLRRVGIEFTACNYAMGGASSGAEMALCHDEIFGQDMDVLIWDIGMTDGRHVEMMALYFYRAGFNHNQLACITYQASGSNHNSWKQAMEYLETIGLTVLNSQEDVMKNVLVVVPDTMGLTDGQINALPLFGRNGNPYCKAEKFNNTMYTNCKVRTSWHAGW
jgi:hypothetical protein